ncbi:65-kDa microtubule-associated protein 3-like [Bidens hawaiensis]|uniref:65-kDa microtubule-associated protein 3-like n=1 Tax=Bidens hawaiensis TaxID=980011 RepID=UPI004049A46E
MTTPTKDPLMQVETTCGSLLHELQVIWNEVGESDVEKDKMLLELERECLEVYRRKVDLANRSRAQLRQAIAECEAELASICSAMGERPVHIRQSDQKTKSLKAELRAILPELEEMRKRKSERKNQFLEVIEQIQRIQMEIYATSFKTVLDETDLSLRKLEELHVQLQALEKEKSDRIKKVLDHMKALNSLCVVLGMDFNQTVHEINPRLAETEGTQSLSNDAIGSLAAAIHKLHEVKRERMQRLQNIARSLLELWNLMDTPIEEQQEFQSVTCNIAASEEEIAEPNLLSVEFINYVEAEVSRLEEFKSSKMKELVFKKILELEDICRKTHLLPVADSSMEIAMEAIETGAIDPASLLEQLELQIGNVKEEAYSRKEILDKVEKWISACEEECWLEEYNNDDNRYNAGRGAHLTLKRAEKARALVNKLPGMVEALAVKTITWEDERGIEFTYDGIRLLSMLEEYKTLRQVKEEERKRQRDQKKIQGQLMAEQEAMFGSKPSPMKQSGKKGSRMSYGGASNRRLSLGGAMHATKTDLHSVRATPNTRHGKKNERQLNINRDDGSSGLSVGRRGLDIAGLPANRKHSISETEPPQPQRQPIFRTPFSPLSSTESSKTNITLLEDLNQKHGMLQKTFQTNTTPFTTPSKTIISATDDENRTPKTHMIPTLPCTPSTVSVPMQTVMTPAPTPLTGVHQLKEMVIPEEVVEYSFEERRAGFVAPKTLLKTVVAA